MCNFPEKINKIICCCTFVALIFSPKLEGKASSNVSQPHLAQRDQLCSQSNQFQCNSGHCINQISVCNGKGDCNDTSDETLKQCGKNQCSKNFFRCGYGACINEKFRCDGVQHCLDGSDEFAEICQNQSATTPIPTLRVVSDVCWKNSFHCKSGGCVDKRLKCDGVKHCPDGSDEFSELCKIQSPTSKPNIQPTIPTIKQTTLPAATTPPINTVISTTQLTNTRLHFFSLENDVVIVMVNLDTISLEGNTVHLAPASCTLPQVSRDKNYTMECIDTIGKKINCSKYQPGEKVPLTTSLIFTCNPGYVYDLERFSARCEASGIWLPPIVNCDKICKPLNKAKNVDLSCHRSDGTIVDCEGSLVVGTSIQLQCAPHYHQEYAVNYREITCQANGEWTNQLFSCVADCGKTNAAPSNTTMYRLTARDGDAPWHVGIFDSSKSLICDGTIITPQLILTAAHCFKYHSKPQEYRRLEVAVSKFKSEYGTKDNQFVRYHKIREVFYPAKNFTSYPHYDNDIALVWVNQKISLSSKVLPACIKWTDKTFSPSEGAIGQVADWYSDPTGHSFSVLFTINLPYISYAKCLKLAEKIGVHFKEVVTPGKFCAGEEKGLYGTLATTLSANGGLLFRDEKTGLYYLRGILNWRESIELSMATFTDIAPYIDWIAEINKKVENQRYVPEKECGYPYANITKLIAYGKPEQYGNSPWNVAIYDISPDEKLLICGGTIISPQLIISAAHCFFDEYTQKQRGIENFEIAVSKISRNYTIKDNGYTKFYKILEIFFTAKGFTGPSTNYASDIVILQVDERISLSSLVLPACIHWSSTNFNPEENAPGKLVGWGHNEKNEPSEVLLVSMLPYISYAKCIETANPEFRGSITVDKFCAGSKNGAGARPGDSGGGLLFPDANTGQYYLQGIVSIKDPTETSIAAFTDVSQYIEWIKQIKYELEG